MKSIFKIEENFLKYLIAPYSLSIFFSILPPPLPPSFNNFSNRKKNRLIFTISIPIFTESIIILIRIISILRATLVSNLFDNYSKSNKLRRIRLSPSINVTISDHFEITH